VVKRAILSDIHGNLEALTAVLADARGRGCEQVVCLGDIVGYGPNPCECVDQVMQFEACILGNHDLAALFDPEGFSNVAEQAIFWTRQQLEGKQRMASEPLSAIRARLDYLSRLPRIRREGNTLFVHGSVRNPVNEYVFPEDVYNRRKMEKLFSMVQKVCFQGHTHVPGVFTSEGQFLRPTDLTEGFSLGEEKSLVNVGSVGQPRDGDWRSCYVILDENRLFFQRVEYDLETTVAKIHAIEELDNFLGDRLRDGK
jgi:predicted phosphodiesterase